MEAQNKDLTAALGKKEGKSNLDEVRADAKFNYISRLREKQLEEEYKAARKLGPEAIRDLADKALEAIHKPQTATTKGK